MDIALPAVGALAILVVCREVFHTLLHPAGQGGLTMRVFRAAWTLTGRLGPSARSLAGPSAMVCVIVLWISALVAGWALIYWPALPDDFIIASPLDTDEQDDFVDALYYSWVTQSTLGYGDIAPDTNLLRILAPLQATVGFGLFTLVVTWVLSVYPALHRQRATATVALALRRAHAQERAADDQPHPATLARQMERLAEMLAGVRIDLIQYPSSFYFAAPDPTAGLAAALPHVRALSRVEGLPAEAASAARELAEALALFAGTVADQHLGMAGAPVDEVLRAYRDHQGRLPGEQLATP